MVVEVAASVCGGVAAGCAAKAWSDHKARMRRRVAALGSQVDGAERPRAPADSRSWPLRYADGLTRKLFVGTTEPITPSVRAKRAGSTRAGALFKERSIAAGCSKDITVSAYCEARTRLALAGAAAGALLGVLLSTELAGRGEELFGGLAWQGRAWDVRCRAWRCAGPYASGPCSPSCTCPRCSRWLRWGCAAA